MTVEEWTGVLGLIGGSIAAGVALYQWNKAQQWQRASKLDEMIKDFESREQIMFGRMILDWTRRTVGYGKDKVSLSNTDALLALRVHTELPRDHDYTADEVKIRDALDCTLGFFDQLSIAVTTRLVDARHAKRFFRYWLHKLVSYEAHPIEDEKKQTQPGAEGSSALRIAKYIGAYGNIEAVVLLCKKLDVAIPKELRAEHDRLHPRTAAS